MKVRFSRFYVLTLSIILLSILSFSELYIVNITHCLAGRACARACACVCVTFFLFSLLLIDLPILYNKTPCISVFDANIQWDSCSLRAVSVWYSMNWVKLIIIEHNGSVERILLDERKARMQIAITDRDKKKWTFTTWNGNNKKYRLCAWELAAYDSACMGNFVQFFCSMAYKMKTDVITNINRTNKEGITSVIPTFPNRFWLNSISNFFLHFQAILKLLMLGQFESPFSKFWLL